MIDLPYHYVQYVSAGISLRELFDSDYEATKKMYEGYDLRVSWAQCLCDVINGVENLHSKGYGSGCIVPENIFFKNTTENKGEGMHWPKFYQVLNFYCNYAVLGDWPYYIKQETFTAAQDKRAILVLFVESIFFLHG